MINFADKEHLIAELVFQGATEHKAEDLCDAEILAALSEWHGRENPTNPYHDAFRLQNTPSFNISYAGETNNYWPDEESNFIGECLVRDFLFQDGICQLQGFSARLYRAKYKLIAAIDTEYLLVCPYPTAAGNIAGILGRLCKQKASGKPRLCGRQR